MRKGSFILGLLLTACTSQFQGQVLAPAEITDPGMRALQQKYLPQLKAAAVDITSHGYPYKFYLSRQLDLTERQEQTSDQRSIRFSDFKGHTVLQVTGNYFAAYQDESMDRGERVKRTYLDVVLPILRATAPRLEQEPQLSAFAIEVSHHVRKRVMGVAMERPENLALIIPREAASKAAVSNNVNDEIAALQQSNIYLDGGSVALWPAQNAEPFGKSQPPVEQASVAAPVAVAAKPASIEPAALHQPPQQPARDLSPQALQQQQTTIQGLLDRIAKELDSQAHFVSYAPPALVSFHKAAYLQLSVSTTLSPSDAGSQYRIAALAFDRHISHLVRPLLAFFKEAPEFDGIVFSSTVRIGGKPADSDIAESVEFFLPLNELRRYADYDITGQQLITSGFVLINGERISLDLQTAESDLR